LSFREVILIGIAAGCWSLVVFKWYENDIHIQAVFASYIHVLGPLLPEQTKVIKAWALAFAAKFLQLCISPLFMLKIIVILFDDWDHKNRLVDGLEGLIHVKGVGDFILVLIWKQRQNTIFNCIRDGTLTFQDFASGSVHDDIVATRLLDVVDALGEMSVYRH